MGSTIATTLLLGLGVVFLGLIVIILLVMAMHGILVRTPGHEEAPKSAAPAPAPVAATSQENAEIPNRQEFVAAVSAVLAEELGTDVSAIRIHSIKRI